MKSQELKSAMERIELSPELYDSILERRKPRPHQGLKVSMVFVVLIFLFGCGSFIWLANYRVAYQNFSVDFAKSVAYACENDGVKATVDGQTLRLSEENAHKVCTYILFAKSGMPESEPPVEDAIRLEFGNGASLDLWEKTEKDGDKRLMLWYTDTEGGTYGYSTSKISFSTIRVTYLLDKDNKPMKGGTTDD